MISSDTGAGPALTGAAAGPGAVVPGSVGALVVSDGGGRAAIAGSARRGRDHIVSDIHGHDTRAEQQSAFRDNQGEMLRRDNSHQHLRDEKRVVRSHMEQLNGVEDAD